MFPISTILIYVSIRYSPFPYGLALNLNQWKSLRISENSLNVIQYSTTNFFGGAKIIIFSLMEKFSGAISIEIQ